MRVGERGGDRHGDRGEIGQRLRQQYEAPKPRLPCRESVGGADPDHGGPGQAEERQLLGHPANPRNPRRVIHFGRSQERGGADYKALQNRLADRVAEGEPSDRYAEPVPSPTRNPISV